MHQKIGRTRYSYACARERKKKLLKYGGGDQRFDENDPTMSLEERMLERFTRERQRAAKSTAFNLEDEDDKACLIWRLQVEGRRGG